VEHLHPHEARIDNGGIWCAPKRACENCGAAGAALFEDLRDPSFGSPGEWALRYCPEPACGLIWLDPQPMPEELFKLYADYYTHADSSGTSPHYRSRPLARALRRTLALVLPWRRGFLRSDDMYLEGMPPGRLLEIGCGNGAFLRIALQAGWQAFGLDFDAAAIDEARKAPGVEAEVGELLQRRYPAAFFDAIVMNNVVEHLWNPRETLAECRRILRPGGRLVMITPNSNSLGCKLFGRHWRGLEPPRHLYLYNDKALGALCRRAGFERIDVGSSPGGRAGLELFSASAQIAAKRGEQLTVDPKRVRSILRRERLLDLCGWTVGEWLVVIAHA
jgi:SAM-dependent methyltransferase